MGPLSTCGRRYWAQPHAGSPVRRVSRGDRATSASNCFDVGSPAAGQFSVSQARSVMARCRAFRSWSKSASVLVRIRVYGLPARKV